MADPVLFQNAFVGFTTATATGSFTELSGVKQVSMPITMAELNDAVMGDQLDAKYPGLIGVPISITCRQDFATAAAGVDKLIYTRQVNRTAFRVQIKPVDAAASGPNPVYEVTRVRIFNSTPIDGAHGTLLENKIELRSQSGATLTRSTNT